ncbi:MAG: CBS domain-containing protein [Nitriliruptorales bacterium]|nr:CBS domain-containing protein [Nitriliruptorales bacterium]
MADSVRDMMTPDPVQLQMTDSVQEAAQRMRAQDIGDVLVVDGERVCGILTDRDITVRAVADGVDPAALRVGDICSGDILTVAPTDTAAEAVQRMREAAVRRVPVVEEGRAVGVVSIGDLAIELDADSALADISDAPPNR